MKFARPACIAALAVLVLSACGGAAGTQAAEIESTRTTSPATTPKPTPKPWEVKSKAGAEAFSVHWAETLYLAQQGDTDRFGQLNQDCDLCDSMVEQLNDVYSTGGSVTGKPYRILETSVQPGGEPNHMTVLVEYSPGKVTWIRTQGGPPEISSGAKVQQLLEVRWISGRWFAVKVIDFAGT